MGPDVEIRHWRSVSASPFAVLQKRLSSQECGFIGQPVTTEHGWWQDRFDAPMRL